MCVFVIIQAVIKYEDSLRIPVSIMPTQWHDAPNLDTEVYPLKVGVMVVAIAFCLLWKPKLSAQIVGIIIHHGERHRYARILRTDTCIFVTAIKHALLFRIKGQS